jgi:hypothetical protein
MSRFVRDLPAESTGRGRVAAPTPRAEPTWNSDIVYDADVPPPSSGYSERAAPVRRRRAADEDAALFVGMAFRHAKFGPGQLVAWDGVGADLKLHLRFGDSATRVILARFCEPM